MRAVVRTALVSVGFVVLTAFAGAVGCDGETSQPAARDRAAGVACDSFERCGSIGSGQAFASRDDCLTQVRNYIQTMLWPPAMCDGRINGNQLDVCLDYIETIQCGNFLQFLDLVGNQCPATTICSGS